MKKSKKIIAALAILCVILTNFMGIVRAEEEGHYNKLSGQNYEFYCIENALSPTEFNAKVLLSTFVANDLTHLESLGYYNKLTAKATSKVEGVDSIKLTDSVNVGESADKFTGIDAKFVLDLNIGEFGDIAKDISNKLNIAEKDVEVIGTVKLKQTILDYISNPANNFVDSNNESLNVKNLKLTSDGKNEIVISSKTITEEKINEIRHLYTILAKKLNIRLAEEEANGEGQEALTISVKAVAEKDNYIITYNLTMGNDFNWYWVPEKKEDKAVAFATTMEYKAVDENGKEVTAKSKKDTTDVFLAPYYENEDKDAKKDANVLVTLKSKTKETILSINDKTLSDTANSEGWYYPDQKDKTVAAKLYKFADYNNITANGKVKETVTIKGADYEKNVAIATANGTSYSADKKTPNIAWTFRRIKYNEEKDKDENVVVTITYNLPIDVKSVPDGWKPVYEKDGKTAYKITTTIKKGEDYKKDVVIGQNGTSEKVTTHVEYKWEKEKKAPNLGPQAGGTIGAALAVLASIGICVVSYRKFKK